MAVTTSEIQVQWDGGNDSDTVTAGGSTTSDAFTVQADCIRAQIELKADNGGTPSGGDTVDFLLLATLGDPDGAGADEYETADHATLLARLDTSQDDPAVAVVEIPLPLKGGKILAESNAATATITVSAAVLQQRFA